MASRLLRWLRAIVILVLVLAAIGGGGLWLIGQEVALRYVMQRLSAESGGVLQVEGLSGSLYGPLTILSIRFENAERRIVVRQLALDWSPTELWHDLLLVHRLSAASIDIITKKSSAEPLTPPSRLRLPLNIRAGEISLGTLTIVAAGGGETRFTGLRGRLNSDAHRHEVNLAGITTPWGKGSALLSLGNEQPFPLAGSVSFQGELGHAFTANATLTGVIAAIGLSVDVQTHGGKANLQTQINPFMRLPLQTVRLEVQQVDLHDLNSAWPFTQLSAQIDGKVDEDRSVSAAVSVQNTLIGPVDQNRLPLRSLQGRLMGNLETWRLETMQLDLGPAGQFTGAGGISGGRADIALTTRNLNLQGAYAKLRATRAAGSIRLTTEGKDFSVQRVQADVIEQHLHIRLDATHRADAILVDAAQLNAGKGELRFKGKLDLTGLRAFQAVGKLQGFNPADFGDYPAASLNADLTGEGRLGDPISVQLRFTLARSELRGYPLSGAGEVELLGNHVTKGDVAVDMAGNHLKVQGAFGRPRDELEWSVDAGQLARLDPSLAGSIRGRGHLRGIATDPAIDFDLTAQDLRLPGGYAVTSLSGNGDMRSGANGPLNIMLNAQGLSSATLKLASAEVQIKGTREQHTVQLRAVQPDSIDLALDLSGGWDAKRGWAGTMQKLVNGGRYAANLAAPAVLEARPDLFSLHAARLELIGGTLNIDELRWAAGELQTSGSAQGISLAYVQKLFPEQGRGDAVSTDLRLTGDWSISAGTAVNGKLTIRRESGDALILSEPKLPLKIESLELALDIAQSRVRGHFAGFSRAGGTLEVDLQTVLEKRDGRWGVAGTAPLDIEVRADMPSIAWTSLFLDERFAVDGKLRFAASRHGPTGSPQLTGNIEGAGLILRVPEYGIALRDGVLRATFAENRLVLDEFRMLADTGELTATGSLTIGKDAAEGGAEIKAQQLHLLAHPDYQLTVSGTGKVTLLGGKLLISGDVRADRGQITLPKHTAPTLGEDVVVMNKPNAPPRAGGAVPLSIDVKLDLGEQFSLRGRGLDAKLGGTVRVKTASRGLPNGTGTIRVISGTYEAYGQKLTIERGVLSFAGPIDNPALDIEAVRKNLAVEAGVSISGSALAPRLRLVSTPVVPDTEKLAWLVLGHGLEGSARSELDLLPVAAAALLSSDSNDSFQRTIARTLGVDEIGVTSSSSSSISSSSSSSASTAGTSTAEQRALTIGKRVSSNLYLTYEQGLSSVERIVRLQYDLSRNWSVRAEAGTRSALDLFYTLRFD